MYNKLFSLAFCLALAWPALRAQKQGYFQQDCSYKIEVTLDDEAHILRGQWQLRYTNNSPDTLKKLFLHLWPNAYKNNFTAFAKHLSSSGNVGFHFAKSEDRGWIDSLAFAVAGKEIDWSYDPENPDIAMLSLPEPLLPGQSLELQSPMRMKFPKSVSRLGQVETSYQATQWYPKPAVYDRAGWHPMPYLNQGEFFSEFGDFEVHISLPENYIVGATGLLQNPEELAFLAQKAKADVKRAFDMLALDADEFDSFPPSAEKYKTLVYKAEGVHDFAWFADKRFFYLQDTLALPSGKIIDVHAMFTHEEADLWKRALLYLKRSTLYYSERLGEYPYPQVTAVQSALSAGAGMEYPMITVIGESGTAKSLDVVITHEVGHNWFYGILASNERRYPWQDEGMNTYVERRYTRAYYGPDAQSSDYLLYLYQYRRGNFQAMGEAAPDFTDFNYWLSVYNLPALWLDALEYYLGTERMDELLRLYYEQWKFKHPYPKDLQSLWEKELGESLAWLFEELIEDGKQLDWELRKAKYEAGKGWTVHIRNRGEVAAPLPLGFLSESDTTILWIGALAAKSDTILTGLFPEKKELLALRIDPKKKFVEAERNNNVYRTKGLRKRGEALKLAAAFSLRHPEKPRLNLLPALGFNTRDGFLLGLSAYNLPELNAWHYRLMPLWGFGSKSPVGMGQLSWTKHRDSMRHKGYSNYGFALHARRFSRFEDLFYNRFAFEAWYAFPDKTARNPHKKRLSTEHLYLYEERLAGGAEPEKVLQGRTVHRLEYRQERKHALLSYLWTSQLEYARWAGSEQQLQLASRLSINKAYYKKNKLSASLLAAGILSHSNRQFGPFPMQLAGRNFTDYHYDHLFLGRNTQRGIWQQFMQGSPYIGGFKVPLPNSVDDGRSNSFLLATNFALDIPFPFITLQSYLDIGYAHASAPILQGQPWQEQLHWNAGLSLRFFNIAVHLPVLGSQVLMRNLRSQGGYFSRIGLELDINSLRPLNLLSRDWF